MPASVFLRGQTKGTHCNWQGHPCVIEQSESKNSWPCRMIGWSWLEIIGHSRQRILMLVHRYGCVWFNTARITSNLIEVSRKCALTVHYKTNSHVHPCKSLRVDFQSLSEASWHSICATQSDGSSHITIMAIMDMHQCASAMLLDLGGTQLGHFLIPLPLLPAAQASATSRSWRLLAA